MEYVYIQQHLWLKGDNLDLQKITGRIETTAWTIPGVIDVLPIHGQHFVPERDWEGYSSSDQIVQDYQDGKLLNDYPMLVQAIDKMIGVRAPLLTPKRSRYCITSGENHKRRK